MLFALTLIGCTTWIDQEPACGQDVYYWSDDVLAHILTGDGSGAFEYDPIDEPRTSIEGEYDPITGDFSWVEKYDQAYYLRRAQVDGFGTVYHNGNLDLYFETAITDMLDETYVTAYRVQRTGCDMSVASWDAENGSVETAAVREGSYEGGEVYEWTTSASGAAYSGSLRPTQLRTQQIQADDDSYWYFTTAKPDGITTTEFTAECGSGLYCEGEYVRMYDGSETEEYEAYDGDELYATIEGSYEYDGSGTQTVRAVGGDECVYTYDADGGCEYACDDGSDGAC
jgi:hypothetical protein